MQWLKSPRTFRKCRLHMTYNETAQKAIPHQDNRSLSGLGRSTRYCRPTIKNRQRRQGKHLRRIRHGIAHSIEVKLFVWGARKHWRKLVSGEMLDTGGFWARDWRSFPRAVDTTA